MEIDKASAEEYLDIVLKNIDDVNFFAANNLLIEKGYFDEDKIEDTHEFLDFIKSVTTLGITYGYFEKLGENNNWCKLTEKGLNAKQVGGHFKYQKSLTKKPITLFEKITIFFLVISFAYNFYQDRQKNALEKEHEKLQIKFDSINKTFMVYKDSIGKIQVSKKEIK